MEDMLELANEVQETLGRQYGLPEDVDEDDLEAGEGIQCTCNHMYSLYTVHVYCTSLDKHGSSNVLVQLQYHTHACPHCPGKFSYTTCANIAISCPQVWVYVLIIYEAIFVIWARLTSKVPTKPMLPWDHAHNMTKYLSHGLIRKYGHCQPQVWYNVTPSGITLYHTPG